jgi:hypothetical protein
VILSLAALAHQGSACEQPAPGSTRLGVEGNRFTINGKSTFLLGVSYYGGLGAAEQFVKADLDDLRKHGFNWIRVWANWSAFGHDTAAVDPQGGANQKQLQKLKWLVAECDQRGVIVDVTLSRGNGVTGPARLQSLAAHKKAVTAILTTLKGHANWYLDLANERNIKDKRYASFEDLQELRTLVRQIDPKRLVTASHAGDIDRDDVQKYGQYVKVDFLAPHRPRSASSPKQTDAKTKTYLQWLKEAGMVIPIHYQEPFRRDFGIYQPSADDFLTDLAGAKKGGAAGWCFHNGDTRSAANGQPRRSFDLTKQRLFDQLDKVEQAVVNGVAKQIEDS